MRMPVHWRSSEIGQGLRRLVPTLCVGTPSPDAPRPSAAGPDNAERRRRRSHAERENEACDDPVPRALRGNTENGRSWVLWPRPDSAEYRTYDPTRSVRTRIHRGHAPAASLSATICHDPSPRSDSVMSW